MKNLLQKLKIRKLRKEGYESYTITINGQLTDMIFYKPAIIFNYNKNKFNY